MTLKKIELLTDKRNRTEDVDKMDHFRDGYSTDLDSPKTSGVLFDLIETVNGLVDVVESLKSQLEEIKAKKAYTKRGGVKTG